MPHVGVRLDQATVEVLDKVCADRNVSRSALVRIALLDYLGGRSDSEAIGLTLVRVLDAFEALQTTLAQIRSDVGGTAENTRITSAVMEATLKVLLYRTVPPPDDDLGAKARAQADYAELTKRIARKISGNRES